jgi:hypothetical protein
MATATRIVKRQSIYFVRITILIISTSPRSDSMQTSTHGQAHCSVRNVEILYMTTSWTKSGAWHRDYRLGLGLAQTKSTACE